jgi:hypothetical protein
MFAGIRTYKVTNMDELSEIVRDEFVPIVETVPGLVAYFVVDTGDGTASSITIAESKEGVLESASRAAAWVEERVPELIESGPEIAVGEVTAVLTEIGLAA